LFNKQKNQLSPRFNREVTEGFWAHFRVPWLLLLFLVAGTGLLITVLFQYSSIHVFKGWMWRLRITELHWEYLLAGVLCVVACLFFLMRKGKLTWLAVILLVSICLISQWSIVLSSGGGFEGMEKYATHSGHKEFTITASRHLEGGSKHLAIPWFRGGRGLNPGTVISDYEKLLKTPNQQYSRTKPPGQLLLYVLIAKAANVVVPSNHQKDYPIPKIVDVPHRQTIDFISVLFPILAALAAWPFFLLCQLFLKEESWVPPVLFLLSPSFSLVLLHFNQAVYPLLVCTMWLAITKATKRDTLWLWAPLAGVLAWLSSFTSFSLLPALALIPFFSLAGAHDKRDVVKPLLISAGVFLICWGLFWILWDYDPFLRFQRAMKYHGAWKQDLMNRVGPAYAAMENTLEFLWWLGPPSAILVFVGIGRAAFHAIGRRLESVDILAFGLLVILTVILIFGNTIGETARLWIFLLPVAFLVAGKELLDLYKRQKWILGLWIFWQFSWSVALKYGQDFW